MENEETRVCKKCGIKQKLEQFSILKGYYRHTCRLCINKRQNELYKLNPERANKYSKKYFAKYTENNKEKLKIKDEKYRKNNPEKIRIARLKRYEKDKINPMFKINNSLRVSIWRSLKTNGGSKNKRHWEDLIGFTVIELKNHLESLFTEGMNWERFLKGEIHIDHIIPISVFNFSSPKHLDFKRCWSLDNLQPMWAKDNLRKHNKLKETFQPNLSI